MFIAEKVSVAELTELSKKMDDAIVKGVADVRQRVMVLDAGMHVDEEELLLERGSQQSDLWGFNYRPEFFGTDAFIQFESMINLRPYDGNRSRDIQREDVRAVIREMTAEVVYA